MVLFQTRIKYSCQFTVRGSRNWDFYAQSFQIDRAYITSVINGATITLIKNILTTVDSPQELAENHLFLKGKIMFSADRVDLATFQAEVTALINKIRQDVKTDLVGQFGNLVLFAYNDGFPDKNDVRETT